MKLYICMILVAAVLSPHSQAGTISKFLPPDDFGHLNQHLTQCKNYGCGPTSAVNSFVFLQNMYPTTYIHSLAGLSQDTEITAANTLSDLMCCTTGSSTNWEKFITGKETYVNNQVPGSTSYGAESTFTWDPGSDGGMPNPDPGNIKTGTIPTPSYIVSQLTAGRDVEILVGQPYNDTFGHYVTVTGMSFDTDTGTGYFEYVDPSDGDDHRRDFTINSNGYISWMNSEGNERVINTAISEGPIGTPEPSGMALLVAGLAVSLASRRRCR